MGRLSAKGKTLARQEDVLIGEGWEQVEHGTTLVHAFAANLRFHRTRRKLTQWDLARIAQLRTGTIPELELAKSNPRISTVEALALALQIDPMFLVRRPAEDGNPPS